MDNLCTLQSRQEKWPRAKSEIHSQRFPKRLLHKGLILQPTLHQGSVYITVISQRGVEHRSTRPLVMLCCWPAVRVKDPKLRPFLFWGVRVGPRAICRGQWFWKDLWPIDSPDRSQIFLFFLQLNNPFKPWLLLGEHLQAKFVSHHWPWHFTDISLEKCWDPGEILAGGVQRLTSSSLNDSGIACLVMKPNIFLRPCNPSTANGTCMQEAAFLLIPLKCFSCSKRTAVWVREAISTLLPYTTALINNSFPSPTLSKAQASLFVTQ